MFDAWQSLDVNYAARLADALGDVAPTWLEEPLLPDQMTGMERLRARTRIPLAGGRAPVHAVGLHAVPARWRL